MREIAARTVVVGSGCAGLNAADWLAALGEDVLLVTEGMNSGTSRNTGSDKQTYYKLSLAGDEEDSVSLMAETLKHDDVDGDIALCEAAGSAQCFLKLVSLGVPFPMNAYGEYVGYQTDHDLRRRASSAGPLTSRYMTEALEKSVRARQVPIADHTMACRIIAGDEGVEGLLCLDTVQQDWLLIRCAHVVLCTGGPAAIYRASVYPVSQFGMSGMAFLAGAEGENLDRWQYGLASVKFRWNVSGSYQQVMPRYVSVEEDGTEHEFLAEKLGETEAMNMTFLKGYQWPFDEAKIQGSSRVDMLVKQENDLGRKVFMDFRRNPSGYDLASISEEARNYLIHCGADRPTPIERLRAMNEPAIQLYWDHGIDLTKDMLEVQVCAQHHNGGIAVNDTWQTCVPGLYVCGEAAGTFGAYRPGGTALNSTQVGSMRAARHIARHSRRKIPEGELAVTLPTAPKGQPAAMMTTLQQAMTRDGAFLRNEQGIRALMTQIATLEAAQETVSSADPLAVQRLRLADMMVTQKQVLSAMLYDLTHKDKGVMMTRDGHSYRRASRPIPERDQWFERVWRTYREQEGQP